MRKSVLSCIVFNVCFKIDLESRFEYWPSMTDPLSGSIVIGHYIFISKIRSSWVRSNRPVLKQFSANSRYDGCYTMDCIHYNLYNSSFI